MADQDDVRRIPLALRETNEKTGASNRAQASMFAVKHGLMANS